MPAGVIERDVGVQMYLPSLASFPADNTELPPGFTLRRYRAGSAEDKAACTAIWQDAERWRMGSNNPNVTLDDTWFPRGFGTDEAVIADRMWFVCAPDGEPVATTTSWYDRDTRGSRGVVHYVGMKKVYAGRGLSKPLFTRVLLRLRELGHTDCHLGTSTGRVEAINLYVKYGFMPNPRSATEYRAWRELQPLLRESFVAPFANKFVPSPSAPAARL